MNYGALIKTVQGKDIILGQEEAMILWHKGTIRFSFSDATPPQWFYLGEVGKDATPMAFFSYRRVSGSTQFGIGCGVSPRMNDNYQIIDNRLHMYFRQDGLATKGSVVVDVDYYIFLKASYMPLPSYGMVIYNSANRVAYHTGGDLLKIHGSHYVTHTNEWNFIYLPTWKQCTYPRDDNTYAYWSDMMYVAGEEYGVKYNSVRNNTHIPFIKKSDY